MSMHLSFMGQIKIEPVLFQCTRKVLHESVRLILKITKVSVPRFLMNTSCVMTQYISSNNKRCKVLQLDTVQSL